MFLHIFVQEKLHVLAAKAMKQYDRLQWSTVPEAVLAPGSGLFPVSSFYAGFTACSTVIT